MPKTMQPVSDRIGFNAKRAERATRQIADESPPTESKANMQDRMMDRERVTYGDRAAVPPELFPTGTPPGMDPTAPDKLDESAVSPEEQREYNQIVTKAAKTIYQAPEKVMAAINDPRTPIHESVGRVVAKLGMAIEDGARATGKKLSPDVMFHAGSEVAAIVLDLGIEAGILPLDPESDEYQKVLGMSMMEASKYFGERMIADPKLGEVHKEDAENTFAMRVAEEVSAGKADPRFMQMMKQRQQTPVAAGVSRALGG